MPNGHVFKVRRGDVFGDYLFLDHHFRRDLLDDRGLRHGRTARAQAQTDDREDDEASHDISPYECVAEFVKIPIFCKGD
jgi:hypothetical protein